MKYGFILNAEGCRPENFTGQFSSPEFMAYVIGTENQKMACEAARYLVEEIGVDAIDLCVDFDLEKQNEIRKAISHKVYIRSALFDEKQSKKLNDIKWDNFGFIVKGEGLNYKDHVINLYVPDFQITMMGVSDVDEACKAVAKMTETGIEVIELCRYFDEEETKKIISCAEKTGRLCAIGSVGLGVQE